MVLTALAEGFCFGEGPRWSNGLLWFSDMLGEAVHSVTMAAEVSTLALPGHRPSGLGFRSDGSLLIVSAERRQLLGYDGDRLSVTAELADMVPAALGDMVIDRHGCAYVGSQAREGGVIVRVDPDQPDTGARAIVVAHDLEFPNGMALTSDGETLIVAESTGRRLTCFTVDPDGALVDRRPFAENLCGPPDGICLDREGGVWTSMTLACSFDRVLPGGEVTDRVAVGERTAIACTLGGPDDRTLFMLSTTSAYPEQLIGTRDGRLDTTVVDAPAASRL